MTTRYSDDELLSKVESLYNRNNKINTTIIRDSSLLNNKTIRERFGSLGKAVAESSIVDDALIECADCGGKFEHLGKHTSQSSCNLPSLTDRQKEIVTGVLMGDGTITEGSNNCEFAVGMVTEDFIYWLQEQLSPFSSNVMVKETENKDIYRLTTTPHKEFTELRSWYDSGQKKFPNKLELTPLILKMWYVTDGGRSNGYPRITSINESDRPNYLLSLFDGLPFGVTWDGTKDIQINSNDVDSFYNYIGEPVPGFKYKWP